MAAALRAVLPAAEGDALTAAEVMARLPDGSRPSGAANLMKYLRADGVRSIGRGVNGDPFRFFRPVVVGL